MKNFIRRWLGLPTLAVQQAYATNPVEKIIHADTMGMRDTLCMSNGTVRFTLYPAANGRVLEVASYKSNPHGPDWTFEHHVIPEDASVPEAITKALAIHALER